MELGSAALGTVAGQGTRASTALAGEHYNRQLHPVELSFIAAKADDHAAYAGIGEDEAKTVVDDAALNIISSIVPVGTAGRAVGQASEAAIKVFTDKAGNLITTFPVKAGN